LRDGVAQLAPGHALHQHEGAAERRVRSVVGERPRDGVARLREMPQPGELALGLRTRAAAMVELEDRCVLPALAILHIRDVAVIEVAFPSVGRQRAALHDLNTALAWKRGHVHAQQSTRQLILRRIHPQSSFTKWHCFPGLFGCTRRAPASSRIWKWTI